MTKFQDELRKTTEFAAERARQQRATAAGMEAAGVPEPQTGGADKQGLFRFLVDATEHAHVEHTRSNKQRADRGQQRLNNLWWFWLRQAKLSDRLRTCDAQRAAKYLSGFYDRCRKIVGGQEAADERTATVARQFITRLAQQGEVQSSFDMEAKVLQFWAKIESTPGESKVSAAARTMFSRRSINAVELVPVVVKNRGKADGTDDFRADSVDPTLSAMKAEEAADASRRFTSSLNGLRADYVARMSDGGGAQQWFGKNCNKAGEKKEGYGWHNRTVDLQVNEDEPRRCFAFLLWELWQQMKASLDPVDRPFWAMSLVMYLGGGDVSKAMAPYVPITDRTVCNLRNWMEEEGVLRLVEQGGKHGRKLKANAYAFDPIGWVLWWSRERLVIRDAKPLDWS